MGGSACSGSYGCRVPGARLTWASCWVPHVFRVSVANRVCVHPVDVLHRAEVQIQNARGVG